jgi:hypothetical protein
MPRFAARHPIVYPVCTNVASAKSPAEEATILRLADNERVPSTPVVDRCCFLKPWRGQPLTEAEQIELAALKKRFPPDPNDPLNDAIAAWGAVAARRS